MALTAAQKTQLYASVFGVPEQGVGIIGWQVTDVAGPTYDQFSFAALITKIDAALALLNATQEARLGDMLTEWDDIKPYDPLDVAVDGGTIGTLLSYPKERELLRQEIGNICGVVIPSGGFYAELKRAASQWTGGRLTR